MGMHDNLRINPKLLPLPVAEQELLKEACNGGFHTKSVANVLALVEITDQGKLRREKSWIEEPDDQEDDTETTSAALVKKQPVWIELPDFTGEVRFREYVGEQEYEFCALFAEGELLKIVKTWPKKASL